MSDFIQIPVKEYELMKEEISLLKDNSYWENLTGW